MLNFDFDSGWDLVLRNTNGQPIISIEIKCKMDKSSSWATRFRQNLLAYELSPITPYFLIALPDWFYLWVDVASHQDGDEPDYIIDSKPIFTPYVERTGTQLEMIGENGLEMLLMSWFSEVTQPDAGNQGKLLAYPWLLDSGLYTALARKTIKMEAAV